MEHLKVLLLAKENEVYGLGCLHNNPTGNNNHPSPGSDPDFMSLLECPSAARPYVEQQVRLQGFHLHSLLSPGGITASNTYNKQTFGKT